MRYFSRFKGYFHILQTVHISCLKAFHKLLTIVTTKDLLENRLTFLMKIKYCILFEIIILKKNSYIALQVY